MVINLHQVDLYSITKLKILCQQVLLLTMVGTDLVILLILIQMENRTTSNKIGSFRGLSFMLCK